MSLKYRNNEDIILTKTRMSPKAQRMKDPNVPKGLTRRKNGTVGKGRSSNGDFLGMLTSNARDILNDGKQGKSLLDMKKNSDFMEEYLNTCDRCGKDISLYKVKHPNQYHLGICKRCDAILENNIGKGIRIRK